MFLEETRKYCEKCKADTVWRFLHGMFGKEKICSECYVGSSELEAHYVPIKTFPQEMVNQQKIQRKKNKPTAFYKQK